MTVVLIDRSYFKRSVSKRGQPRQCGNRSGLWRKGALVEGNVKVKGTERENDEHGLLALCLRRHRHGEHEETDEDALRFGNSNASCYGRSLGMKHVDLPQPDVNPVSLNPIPSTKTRTSRDRLVRGILHPNRGRFQSYRCSSVRSVIARKHRTQYRHQRSALSPWTA